MHTGPVLCQCCNRQCGPTLVVCATIISWRCYHVVVAIWVFTMHSAMSQMVPMRCFFVWGIWWEVYAVYIGWLSKAFVGSRLPAIVVCMLLAALCVCPPAERTVIAHNNKIKELR